MEVYNANLAINNRNRVPDIGMRRNKGEGMKLTGKNLIKMRVQEGLTCLELAKRCGLSRQVIHQTESGKRKACEFIEERLHRYFFGITKEIIFVPFLTEDEMISAKPLLDYNTGPTVGDSDRIDTLTLMKMINHYDEM